jgi:DNA-binding NarL/FixJ family response regulator
MPLVDGVIASARIAKSLPHVPILIFAIHKSARIENEAKEAGVRSVILKTNPAALLTTVETILGGNPNPGLSQPTSDAQPVVDIFLSKTRFEIFLLRNNHDKLQQKEYWK